MPKGYTAGSAWASKEQMLSRIGNECVVGPALDALAVDAPDHFQRRWPQLAAWFRYGIYGLVVSGRTVYIGKSPRPIFAVKDHRLPGPAWMGHVLFERAWVLPSHPDRADADMSAALRRYGLVSNAA